MKSVLIYALISDLKMNDVTYVKGTTAGGYKRNITQTPLYPLLKTSMRKIISRMGTYAISISKIRFEAQYPARDIPDKSY